MNLLQTYLFGNTVQDYMISAGIFIFGVFITKHAYHMLRQAVSKWATTAQTELGEKSVIRVCKLITWAIPIMGFTLAKNRLILDEPVSFWTTNVVLISGQIVFLLILVDTLPPLVKTVSRRYLESIMKEKPEYPHGLKQSAETVARHIKELLIILLIFVPLLTILSNTGLIPMIVWALPVIIVLIKLAACCRIISAANRMAKKREAAGITDEALTSSGLATDASSQDSRIRDTVVGFFLNLFKRQLRLPEGTRSEFFPVDAESSAGNYIYELRVRVGNDWKARRMTIAPLTEEGGSRSQCFYVIYDDHLVIKLPGTQIGDLSDYVESLRKEAGIMDKLAMKECVIPGVSVILRKLHTFSDEAHYTPEEVEARYIRWLTASPEFQKYLKIGGEFAFFMDFSKHYFLQRIVEDIHGTEEQIYKEALGHSEIIADLPVLESRYGSEKLPIFEEIQNLCAKYETEVTKWLAKHEMSSATSQHEIRGWFFMSLAASGATEVEKWLSPDLAAEFNALLGNVIATNHEAVERYRNTIRECTSETRFMQNKGVIEGLITNLMNLLLHLRHRGVAVRDLKPDNLLVAGAPGEYPAFLSYASEYKIGLIDVETAVIVDTPKFKEIEQPVLGGTPRYATPSHFFANEVLKDTFNDVSNILCMQDWHAMVVVIYRVITGEVLFRKTAELVTGIVEIIRKASESGQEPSGIVKNVSELFWRKAVVEFREKMAQSAKVLRSVNVVIPEMATAILREYVVEEKLHMARRIRECVTSQRIFASDKNRQYLLSCSHEETMQLRKKCLNGGRAGGFKSADSAQLAEFLQKLGRLKSRLEGQKRMADLLGESTPTLSAYELLELMHGIVVRHMYRPEWGPLPEQESL